MKKIYFESDIKIVESYPGTDDFVYHFFTQKKDGKRYDVSLDIGNCRKATDDEGKEKLVIALNSHGLEPGILKVLREMNYTDPDFEDFHYNKKQESWYDVKLVDGESDDADFPLASRTEGNRLVRLKGDKSLIGQFIDVKITDSNTWALYGEPV